MHIHMHMCKWIYICKYVYLEIEKACVSSYKVVENVVQAIYDH